MCCLTDLIKTYMNETLKMHWWQTSLNFYWNWAKDSLIWEDNSVYQ